MAHHTLNKYELARILGARALQLSYGAPPLLEVASGEAAIDVARRELDSGVIPLVVLR
jgi:DNA-directed RNA polymerase subunit K/omega